MRRIGARRDGGLPGRQVRVRDSVDFLVRRKIDDGESVEAGQLNEDPLGRAVGIGGERHRADAQVLVEHPRRLIGLRVDDVDRLALNGTGHDILAVRRDVRVVDAALGRKRLDVLQRGGVDHIDAAGRLDDADVDPLSIGSHRDIVGVAAQRDAVGHLQRLRVDDVERAVRFVAHVDPGALRGDRDAVVHFDPFDHSHHLVRDGIDDVDRVSSAVGLDDPDVALLRGRRRPRAQQDRAEQDEPPPKRICGRHVTPLQSFREPMPSWPATPGRPVSRIACRRCGKNRRRPLGGAGGRAAGSSGCRAPPCAWPPRSS